MAFNCNFGTKSLPYSIEQERDISVLSVDNDGKERSHDSIIFPHFCDSFFFVFYFALEMHFQSDKEQNPTDYKSVTFEVEKQKVSQLFFG